LKILYISVQLWLAAIEDLEQSGLETTPVPSSFPLELEKREFAYQFWNNSEGTQSEQGRWAKGPSMDGKGEFEYVANPQPLGPEPHPPQPDPKLHGTGDVPHNNQQGNGHSAPPLVERII
jgi:Mn-containing catalase